MTHVHYYCGLFSPACHTQGRYGKRAIYAKLPDDVKATRFCSKNAFDSWKRDELSNSGAVHDNYSSKGRDYWKLLRKFLNKLETEERNKYMLHPNLMKNCFGNS